MALLPDAMGHFRLPEPPRPVRYTDFATHLRLAAWAGWVVLVAGGGGAWTHFFLRNRDLRADPVTVMGTVMRLEAHTGGKSRSYYVHYSFNANGSLYSDRQSVSRDFYSRLHSGGSVPITYARNDPTNRSLGDRESATDPIWLIVTGGLGVTAVIAWPILLERRYRMQFERATNGVETVGRIVDLVPSRWRKNPTMTIHYDYRADDGTVHSGRFTVSAYKSAMFSMGQEINILTETDNPQSCLAVNEFDLIRFEDVERNG